MNFEEEISLLIKSRYPLLLVDTIDESYVLGQLYAVAEAQSLTFYSWSLTKGLRVGKNENSFYKTDSAVAMLRIANDLVKDPHSAIFTFSDFDRFLTDASVSRLFKDLLDTMKGTPSTVVLLGAEGRLPPDLAPLAARISGGYPDERQILAEVNKAVSEFRLTGVHLTVDMPPETLGCEGFSGAEIEQAVLSALYSASGAGEKIASKHVLEQLKLTRPLSVIKAESVDFLRNWAKERNILPV